MNKLLKKKSLNKLIKKNLIKFCPLCGSSYIIKYKIFKMGVKKIEGCIQPECDFCNKEI